MVLYDSMFSPLPSVLPFKAFLFPHIPHSIVILWLFPSLCTHLFACHFPFMSITISLHFLLSSFASTDPAPYPFVSCKPSLFNCLSFSVLFCMHSFLVLSHIDFIFLQDLWRYLSWSLSPSPCPLPSYPLLSFTSTCIFFFFSSSKFNPAVSEWPESVSLHYSLSLPLFRNTFKNQ